MTNMVGCFIDRCSQLSRLIYIIEKDNTRTGNESNAGARPKQVSKAPEWKEHTQTGRTENSRMEDNQLSINLPGQECGFSKSYNSNQVDSITGMDTLSGEPTKSN